MTPGDPDAEVLQAARDVAAARDRAALALGDFERSVRRVLDWRAPIRRHPLLFALAAGLAGCALGRAVERCRRRP